VCGRAPGRRQGAPDRIEPEKSGRDGRHRGEWSTKGAAMIEMLNHLVDAVEERISDEIDIEALAATMGTTGYHARRMFSSLAGVPVSEYVRRRRMTVAAADVVGDEDFLTIAVRYGYGSTEAFGRAFRAVHGVSHGDARRNGGPSRNYPQLRFRLDRRSPRLNSGHVTV